MYQGSPASRRRDLWVQGKLTYVVRQFGIHHGLLTLPAWGLTDRLCVAWSGCLASERDREPPHIPPVTYATCRRRPNSALSAIRRTFKQWHAHCVK